MPAQGKFVIGGQTYHVAKRNLEGLDNGDIRSTQHFVLLSYGVFDWLTIDLKGGAGDIHHQRDFADEISYPAFMSGGYGFRLRLYEQNATKVVFGFQHISVHPYTQAISGNAEGEKFKTVLDDWQISFLASHNVWKLTPYAGLRWARMDLIRWVNDDNRNRIKSEDSESIGVIIGIDIPVHDRVWVNVEGSFADAQALAGSLNFSF